MTSLTLSDKEQKFLYRICSYIEGDISRPLFYMDINALAREMGITKDDVYALAHTLSKRGLIEITVAGYLEVIMVKVTSSGYEYMKVIRRR